MSGPEKAPPSVTESPWFWVMLFSLTALAALATIGPKFERREQAIETRFHARERAAGREAFEPAVDDTPAAAPQWDPIFTLGPIAGILCIIAIVAMVNVVRFHRRRLATLRRD
jgi:hypothetical protein